MADVQAGHVGPMLGPGQRLRQYIPEEVPHAIEFCTDEAAHLHGVIERRLSETHSFACGEFPIADIGIHPWLVSRERQGQSWTDFPNLARCWYENIAARPAAERALEVGSELHPPITDLDGKSQRHAVL